MYPHVTQVPEMNHNSPAFNPLTPSRVAYDYETLHTLRSSKDHDNVADMNVFVYTCLIPCGKFGPPYLGKATYSSRKSSATQTYKYMLGLFVFPKSTEL